MLLLSLLVLPFLLGANGTAVVLVFVPAMAGVDWIGAEWLVLLAILTLVFLAIAGFFWWAMYQRIRNYLRSGASRRSRKKALLFAVLFHCVLVGLPAAIWARGIAAYSEYVMESRHGGKRCPVCGEYAVEDRTPFGESLLIISLNSRGNMYTGRSWYRCRECRTVFLMRRGELVRQRANEASPFPLFMEEMSSAEQMEELVKRLEMQRPEDSGNQVGEGYARPSREVEGVAPGR
jgi:signal transduction histidine kinase